MPLPPDETSEFADEMYRGIERSVPWQGRGPLSKVAVLFRVLCESVHHFNKYGVSPDLQSRPFDECYVDILRGAVLSRI